MLLLRPTKRDLRMQDAQEGVLQEIIRPSGRMKCEPFDKLLRAFLSCRANDLLGGDYPKTIAYLQEFGAPKL
jgi:hypothetical protein